MRWSPTSAGTIWNPPTISSTLPGGVSGALWASKPLCSLTLRQTAGGHDPLLFPPIWCVFGLSLRTCVQRTPPAVYARTQKNAQVLLYRGRWQSVKLAFCQNQLVILANWKSRTSWWAGVRKSLTASLPGARVQRAQLFAPVIWCCASYTTGYYLAQNGGKSSSFAASFSPGKMLKRRLEKSFIVRLFTYNK